MLDRLTQNWWMLAVRGAVAIIFGILAWVWPGITLFVLVVLFGAYSLVDGVVAIAGAIRGVPGTSRGWMAFTGVCGVLVGLIALFWPGVTSLVMLMLIAAWAVVTGVFEIIAAISMRKEVSGTGWEVFSGVVSVLFGVVLFAWPATGVLTLVWLVGLFSVLFGIVSLVAAFRLRKIGHEDEQHVEDTPGTPGTPGPATV
ncbi:MAG TPA: HdeD family acid-resistance protein [Streptosporangiaceae bacterium]|jgi:uncharacterized membrane protein HdeD (DUF308 family)